MESNLKILHIATDDKFINSANYQFEKIYPRKNIFKILIKKNYGNLRHVRPSSNIEILYLESLDDKLFLNELFRSDLVVLHGLNSHTSKLILNYSKKVKFLWLFWGSELFNHPSKPLGEIYGEDTKKEFKLTGSSNYLSNKFKAVYYYLRYREDYFEYIKAAKKIKYFGNFNKDLFYKILSKKLLRKDAMHLSFFYYPIEFIFKGNEMSKISGSDILLGNSAYPTNNHLEAFRILEKINLGDRKIIAPLSYGDKKYAERIVERGKETFGEKFEPMLDFLKLDEYQKRIQRCGFMIINSYRMQSNGNIFAMIWMGAKVFLNKRNVTYLFLKSLGLKVFSVDEDLVESNDNIFSPLSEAEIRTNREILNREVGEKKLIKQLKFQLELIINEPV